MESNILVCSFSKKDNLIKDIDAINKTYELPRKKIFVFEANNSEEIFCTFNVPSKTQLDQGIIPLHRKSHTNTLYTINALNLIVRRMNNGMMSEMVQVPWDNYKNSLLLSNDKGELRIYKLNLLNIFDV